MSDSLCNYYRILSIDANDISFEALEDIVFTNCDKLNLSEAVNLISALFDKGSADLIEILDRIIGTHIHDASP